MRTEEVRGMYAFSLSSNFLLPLAASAPYCFFATRAAYSMRVAIILVFSKEINDQINSIQIKGVFENSTISETIEHLAM